MTWLLVAVGVVSAGLGLGLAVSKELPRGARVCFGFIFVAFGVLLVTANLR